MRTVVPIRPSEPFPNRTRTGMGPGSPAGVTVSFMAEGGETVETVETVETPK
jgi:hypothetical protein